MSVSRVAIFLMSLMFCFGPVWAGRENELPVEVLPPEGFPTIEEIKIQTIDGTEIPGEDLLGQAVAVVFLKPTCGKCTMKLPGVDKSFQTFKDEGFTVVAVSSAGDKEALAPVAQRYGYDWIWAQNSGEIKKQLDNHVAFQIVIFDMAGVPRFRIDENDADWKVHLELCIGAAIERALDLSAFPQAYVGSPICGLCHMQEWEQWLGTAHAHSMDSLRKRQNQYKLECVVCHVTGEAGKDVRPWRMTPRELQSVGCEECHGPGGPHRTVPYPGAEIHSTEESSCVRCHDEENSPNWDYETYLAKVVHQGGSEASESEVESSPKQNGEDKDPGADQVEEATEEREHSGKNGGKG
ncbi:MAG: redoxin domain-containing protein [Candidatus Omnitrophica bacterium]|nr:redoxin domain-containing protein [Candidatus Omnitrophota bacterium]